MFKRISLLIAVIAVTASTAWAWKPTFIGHRGCYRGVANTVEAYTNGVEIYNYQGLECDVRVTKDGQYVILHDESTGSLCSTDLTVATSTLAELKALTFTQTRGGVTYTGQICTVSEYLDICQAKGVIPMMELKWATGINSNDMTNFAGLLQLIEAHGLRQKVILLTSMYKSIEYIRTNYPDLTCQYLVSSDSDTKFEFCKKWDVNPSFEASALTQAIVTRYREIGREVAAWTVNTEANYRKYCGMGVFMITCDYLRPDDMPELDEPSSVDPPEDALQIEASALWTRSAVDNNLPTDFPSKAGATYTTGQQAAIVDGQFYVSDYGTKSILVMDRDCEAVTVLPFADASLGGSPMHGLTTDDDGNLVQRYESSISSTPSRVRLFKKGTTVPVTVDFTLTDTGVNNFVAASGDLFSAEGGYLYFLPNGQKKMSAVKIANGALVGTSESDELSISGSTASIVIPMANDPERFIYMVRQNGFYLYDGANKGSIVTGASTTQPARNSSLGGAYMELGGHRLLAHPSGTNYNGGFTIIDMDADNAALVSFPALGTQGYTVNASTGTFMHPVKIDDSTYHLYNYTMGNGYGVYEIKLTGSSGVADVAADKAEAYVRVYPNPVKAQTVVSGNRGLGQVRIYSLSGREVKRADAGDADHVSVDLSGLSAGVYVLATSEGLTAKLVKL